MVKTLTLALAGILGVGAVAAQVKKQFTVDNQENCKTVDLSLRAKTGNCYIRSSQTSELLNIYSNQNLEEYAHSFSNEVKGAICFVKLALEQEGQSEQARVAGDLVDLERVRGRAHAGAGAHERHADPQQAEVAMREGRERRRPRGCRRCGVSHYR